MSREERLVDLKQRMVAKYGSCLLAIAEDAETFPVIRKDDNKEEREYKLQRKKEIIEARELAYREKVPEMLSELHKIIDRIRAARSEQTAVGMQSVYSTSTAALSVYSIMCERCGNRDPNRIVTDGRRGDRICIGFDGNGCGAVVQDHIEVQGADRRNFEGEDDRRQFGPAPNRLLSDVANMETSLNIEMKGTGRDNSAWKRISQAQQSVEMSLSSVGKDEKHTRDGYKTDHKKKAFAKLEEIASAMNIHMQVVQRAKEEFAKYREVREALHNFEGVLLGCLVIAFEELSPHLLFAPERKYVTADESGILDANNSFGRVRPRQEVAEDVAVSAVPAVSMGRFTLEQVREWLLAVARETAAPVVSSGGNGASSAVTSANVSVGVSNGVSGGAGGGASGAHKSYEHEAHRVGDYIASLLEKPAVAEATTAVPTLTTNKVRELPKSSIFGTVTVSSRLKRYRTSSTSSNGSSGPGNGHGADSSVLRAGQHLLRVQNIAAALHRTADHTASSSSATESKTTDAADAVDTQRDEDHRQAEILFREAVIRRSQYDAALQEYERVVGLQNTRMRIEDQISTNFQASVLQARKTTAGAIKTEDAEGEGHQQHKRARTESHAPAAAVAPVPVSTASSAAGKTAQAAAAATAAAPVEEEEAFDFDLEELVGGPVASADKSKYANLRRTSNGHAASAMRDSGAGHSGSAHISSQRSTSSTQLDSSAGTNGAVAHASSNAAGPSGSAGAAAAANKKVGMKPRPKIVIS